MPCTSEFFLERVEVKLGSVSANKAFEYIAEKYPSVDVNPRNGQMGSYNSGVLKVAKAEMEQYYAAHSLMVQIHSQYKCCKEIRNIGGNFVIIDNRGKPVAIVGKDKKIVMKLEDYGPLNAGSLRTNLGIDLKLTAERHKGGPHTHGAVEHSHA